jgi:hypothetical protein
VIPADLTAVLARAAARLADAGDLPAAARGVTAAGTWRPAPATADAAGAAAPAMADAARAVAPAMADAAGADAARAAASSDVARTAAEAVATRGAAYATSLPFEIARRSGEHPAAVAARLAAAIAPVS